MKATSKQTGQVSTIKIERIRVNRQGYTSQGRYYGVGDPIYRAYDDESLGDDFSHEFRASTRKAAESIVRTELARKGFVPS